MQINIAMSNEISFSFKSTDNLTSNESVYSKLHDAIIHIDRHTPEDIQRLISAGENVNLKISNAPSFFNGWTPLHICCLFNYSTDSDKNYAFMKILIDNGADVNARDDEGQTPLDVVINDRSHNWYGFNITKFVVLLIEAGVSEATLLQRADYGQINYVNNYENLNDLEKAEIDNYIRSRNIKPARK